MERERDEIDKEEIWDRITNATFEEMDEIREDLEILASPDEDRDLFDHYYLKNVALMQGAL